jgi:hypothetical protein
MTYEYSAKPKVKVSPDAYFMLSVSMGQIKFKIPCRGYNLGSWLKFQASMKADCDYTESSEDDHKMFWYPEIYGPVIAAPAKNSRNENFIGAFRSSRK